MAGGKLTDRRPGKTIVPMGSADTHAALLSGPRILGGREPEVDLLGSRPSVVVVDPFVGRFINSYKVVEFLGCGGMGTVYKAEDPKHPGKFVALKLMHPQLCVVETARRMFYREVQTAMRVSHPNVVKVLDFDEFNRQLYLVMEYIDGTDLSNRVARNGRLTLTQLLNIGVKLCNGIGAVHSHGIVHRDLKLENVIITGDPDHPTIKIVDMGLAKIFDSEQLGVAAGVTTPGVVKGTPEFMSPEAFSGSSLDHRTDIYSLGVILYYLSCDHFPFTSDSDKRDADGVMQIGVKVMTRKAKSPTEIDSSVPKTLSNIIMRAIARDAADRFQTAKELRDALVECASIASIPLDQSDAHLTDLSAPIIITQRRIPKFVWVAIGALSVAVAGLLTFNLVRPHQKPEEQNQAKVEQVQEMQYDVLINTNPPGALVEMHETASDGTVWLRNVGETPVKNKFVGRKTVVISAPGYYPQYVDVDQENNQFDLVMRPIQK